MLCAALAVGPCLVSGYAQTFEPAARLHESAVSGAVIASSSRAESGTRGSRESWLWVHSGVAVQLAGTFSDWATSWKQPEGNQLLAQSGGAYAGRFYREGTVRKFGLAAGISTMSYLVAWKWPRARRVVGIFNVSMGASFAAAAVHNAIVNPYYRP